MSNSNNRRNKISQKFSAIASIFSGAGGSHKKSQPTQINIGNATVGIKKKSRSLSTSRKVGDCTNDQTDSSKRQFTWEHNISSESNSAMSPPSTTTSTDLTSPVSVSSALFKENKLFLSPSTSLMAPSPSAEAELGCGIEMSASPASPTSPVSSSPTPATAPEPKPLHRKPTDIVISMRCISADDDCKTQRAQTIAPPTSTSTQLSVIERQFPEYMKMSPICTPPQPLDASLSTPMSFQHLFAIINEQQLQDKYEESLSLNDAECEYEFDDEDEDDDAEIVFPGEHDMKKEVADFKLFGAMSLQQFLLRFGIDMHEHAALSQQCTGIKNVNDLVYVSPRQILSAPVLKSLDYRTKLSLQNMVHFMATQIATQQHWSGDNVHAWQQFDVFDGKREVTQPRLQKSCDTIEMLSASIADKRYWLFGGESNRCCLSGECSQYLHLGKEIDCAFFSMAMEIESCSSTKFCGIDDAMFVFGIEFVDLQATLCINSKFELFRNDTFVKRVSMQRLKDGSRMCLNFSRNDDACVVSVKVDGDASYETFAVEGTSKIHLFVQQLHGRCTYGIYPISK